MKFTEILRERLGAEVKAASCHSVAREIGTISQPGLRKFLLGESNGGGDLIDALAERYGLVPAPRPKAPRRKKPGAARKKLAKLPATTVLGRIARHEATDDIGDERDSGEGVWVYLRSGWCWEGLHTIREDSATAALAALGRVKPCSCRDCERATKCSAD